MSRQICASPVFPASVCFHAYALIFPAYPLPPIIDLNNALVSFVLTGHHAFVTAAGKAKIAAAQKARWAKIKAAKLEVKAAKPEVKAV